MARFRREAIHRQASFAISVALSILTLPMLPGCALTAESEIVEQSEHWQATDPVRSVSAPVAGRHGSVTGARVSRRGPEARVDAHVMPVAERFHPLVDSSARGSISVGTVTTGYLARSVEMPMVGGHHQILERVVGRHTRFTTDEMKGLLLCVAQRLGAAHPDQKLLIGNLSRRGGGDLPWSVSHNSGRDADLAFLARRYDGRAAVPDHMYRFDRALQANGSAEPMVFDVAANWTVVKSLLTCPGNGVQILFIARWLRHALLRYARATKEPSRVIALARQFLRQPSRSSAHADHLHVRIGCAHDDLAEGCLTSHRQTASSYATPHVQRRLPALRRALGSEQAKRRAGAAYLLSLFADKRSLPQLRGALDDRNFEVRARAVDAIARLDPKGAAEVIHRVLERESNAHVALIQMRALARLRATEFLAWRLRDPRVLPGDGVIVPDVVVRKVALELLAESDSLAAAGMVVPLLSDPVSAVRNQAHDTLGRIVNRSTADLVLQSAIRDMAKDDIDERTPASLQWPLTPDDHVALWTRFLATIPASASRRDVALEGFQQRGLPIRTLSRRQLSYLATALGWESPYCHNAARLIARLVRYQPEVGRGAHSDPRGFWMPWLLRRKLIDPHLMAVTTRLHQDVVAELIADP